MRLWPDRFDLLHTIWVTGFASLFPEGTEGVDAGLAEVIRQGEDFSGADLAAAHLQRQELKAQMAALMEPYDVLLLPTVATPAFTAGNDHPDQVDGVDANYLDWAWLTYTFNLSEQPAISLPCSSTSDGLPIGAQLVGHHHADASLPRETQAVTSVSTSAPAEVAPQRVPLAGMWRCRCEQSGRAAIRQPVRALHPSRGNRSVVMRYSVDVR